MIRESIVQSVLKMLRFIDLIRVYRPLNSQTPFPTLASLLRITSPSQFHIPTINDRAKDYLSRMYHGGPDPFAHQHPQEHLEDALELAMNFDVGVEVFDFSSSPCLYVPS